MLLINKKREKAQNIRLRIMQITSCVCVRVTHDKKTLLFKVSLVYRVLITHQPKRKFYVNNEMLLSPFERKILTVVEKHTLSQIKSREISLP